MDELPTKHKSERDSAPAEFVHIPPGMSVSLTDKQECSTCTVVAPITNQVAGYVRKRHDINLSRKQASNLKRIALGLGQSGNRLENGKIVDTGSDAIKWMLENVN